MISFQDVLFIEMFIYFYVQGVFGLCVYTCTMYVLDGLGGQRKVLDILDPELLVVVYGHVGARN